VATTLLVAGPSLTLCIPGKTLFASNCIRLLQWHTQCR